MFFQLKTCVDDIFVSTLKTLFRSWTEGGQPRELLEVSPGPETSIQSSITAVIVLWMVLQWLMTARVQTMQSGEAMTVTTVTTHHRARAARQPSDTCATCQLNNPLIYTRGSPYTWATDDDDP